MFCYKIPGYDPLVEIQNDLGFQVSSGLKASHSVVVISWGIYKASIGGPFDTSKPKV